MSSCKKFSVFFLAFYAVYSVVLAFWAITQILSLPENFDLNNDLKVRLIAGIVASVLIKFSIALCAYHSNKVPLSIGLIFLVMYFAYYLRMFKILVSFTAVRGSTDCGSNGLSLLIYFLGGKIIKFEEILI